MLSASSHRSQCVAKGSSNGRVVIQGVGSSFSAPATGDADVQLFREVRGGGGVACDAVPAGSTWAQLREVGRGVQGSSMLTHSARAQLDYNGDGARVTTL